MTSLRAFVSDAPASGFTVLRAKLQYIIDQRRHARAKRQQIKSITWQLGMYSDRELGDLGLNRSDIPDVANGTFRRK